MPDGVPRPAIGSYVQRHVAAAAEAIGPDAHMSVTFCTAPLGAGVDRLDVQPDIA